MCHRPLYKERTVSTTFGGVQELTNPCGAPHGPSSASGLVVDEDAKCPCGAPRRPSRRAPGGCHSRSAESASSTMGDTVSAALAAERSPAQMGERRQDGRALRIVPRGAGSAAAAAADSNKQRPCPAASRAAHLSNSSCCVRVSPRRRRGCIRVFWREFSCWRASPETPFGGVRLAECVWRSARPLRWGLSAEEAGVGQEVGTEQRRG